MNFSSATITGRITNANSVYITNTTGSGTAYYIPFMTTYSSGDASLRANNHLYMYDTASESWLNSGASGRKGGLTL
jgi:hypothetical protein